MRHRRETRAAACGCGRRTSQRQHQRNRQQRGERGCEHRARPARRSDDELHERREHRLSDRAAGVDEARRERALLGRQTLRGDADQDRETSRCSTRRRQHTHRQQQSDARRRERRQHATEREHDRAGHDDLHRAVLVGDRAEDRLRRAEHELPDREREAHRHDGNAGRLRDRDQEQARRLPRAHGDEQDRAGREHQRPQLSCGRRIERCRPFA